MDRWKVFIPSKSHHNAQVITGFLMLKENGLDIEIIDDSHNQDNPFFNMPIIYAQYRGKKIIFDHWDGYQFPELIKRGLEWADIYFKRSFSAEKNALYFPDETQKMYPLGFNYHVTYRNSPFSEPLWKHLIKKLLGREINGYFLPKVFEGHAHKAQGPAKIIFFTRLWDQNKLGLNSAMQEERAQINKMRIDLLRALKERYGDAFIGGLNDTQLSREMAPDLIVPAKYTGRKKYIALLHSCDICIGAMGLHESIGWKTAEYIAAAKAIVNESLHYSVPGDFEIGKNYLEFSTTNECIAAVQKLVDNPQLLYDIKKANEVYYLNYLKPDSLVANSLKIVNNL